MQAADARIDWFERGIAVIYSAVAVLGVVVVVLTAAFYLSGADQGSLLIP